MSAELCEFDIHDYFDMLTDDELLTEYLVLTNNMNRAKPNTRYFEKCLYGVVEYAQALHERGIDIKPTVH